MRRLFELGSTTGLKLGYLYRGGGCMEDVVFAIRCFLANLPEPKDVRFLVWPTSSELKSEEACIYYVSQCNKL